MEVLHAFGIICLKIFLAIFTAILVSSIGGYRYNPISRRKKPVPPPPPPPAKYHCCCCRGRCHGKR